MCRLQMRMPLTLVSQELTTFMYRAVNDMLMTVDQMELSRAEYRGALLWMRDVSERLDPDAEKRLHKFRLVDTHHRLTSNCRYSRDVSLKTRSCS